MKFLKILISDREIFTAFLHRLSQLIAGLILVLIAPFKLSAIEQGLFFTFLSITALQVLFELGLNQALIQTAANYFGRISSATSLSYANEFGLKLQGFYRKIKKVFFWISISFFICILIFGLYFFSISEDVSSSKWMMPWFFLVLLTSFNLYLTAQLSFFEGLGRVASINKMRISQSLLASLLMILILYSPAPLWSVLALPFISFCTNFLWLFQNSHYLDSIMPVDFKDDETYVFSWMQNIFSLQWKISLSWISGYFVFYFFIPFIFIIYGPIIAGQFGLCFNIIRSLSTVSLSWVTPKLPELSKLYAEKNYDIFHANYFKYSLSSSLVAFLLLGCSFLFIFSLNYLEIDFAKRFLSIHAMFFLCLIGFADLVLHNLALYTRAQRIEPMYVLSLFSGFIVILISFLGNLFDLDVLLFIRALALYLLIIPLGFIIFRKYQVLSL